jgi:hypothetical protein
VTIYVEEDGISPSTREFRLRFGLFQPSQVLRDALYRKWLREQHEAVRAEVPLGSGIDRRDIPVQQSGSIPEVRPSPVAYPTPGYAGPVVGDTWIQDQSVLPGTTPSILQSQAQTGGPRMAFDLGNLVSDIAGQYITTRWGTPQPIMPGGFPPGGITPTPVATYPGGVGVGQLPSPALAGGPLAAAGRGIYGFLQGSSKWKIAAYLGSLGLALSADEIAQMAADLSKVKCKRRRRRLATHSDIKDLAALSAVLGKGKLLETWVATRRI